MLKTIHLKPSVLLVENAQMAITQYGNFFPNERTCETCKYFMKDTTNFKKEHEFDRCRYFEIKPTNTYPTFWNNYTEATNKQTAVLYHSCNTARKTEKMCGRAGKKWTPIQFPNSLFGAVIEFFEKNSYEL